MLCTIDFEYNTTSEKLLNLVCVAWSVDRGESNSLWLHKDSENKARFKKILEDLIDLKCIFICFNASAEARSFLSLGIDPTRVRWLDLQCEYKMMANHYLPIRYGKQLIKGVEKVTSLKNYYGKKRAGKSHDLPEMSLVSMTYKFLSIKEDLKYKNKIRDCIIKSTDFTEEKQQEILTYCAKDIKDLFALMDKVFFFYNSPQFPVKKFSGGNIVKEALYRGECAARSSVIEAIGIPINVKKTRTLAENVPSILNECAKEILELFPEIEPFVWNKKDGRYSKKEKNIQGFIEESKYGIEWERTGTGKLSLKLDSFTDRFSYRHDYPKDNFFAQMIRYLRLVQSFNGLKIKSKDLQDVTIKRSANVFDSLGMDGRIRPYLNIYGSQTARYQPKALTFPFLWAAWMRSIVEPPVGSFICGIDYSSQEFLVSALLSKDPNMIEAYKSGDPYLYFAKIAKAVPWEGTKEEYSKERGLFKSTTLGLSYGMGSKSLAAKLEADTGIPHTADEAQELINKFNEAYPIYHEYTQEILVRYEEDECIKLVDGWYLFGDNPNPRSVGNMPIQGMGSCILRKAIELCQDAGLKVIFPLHDALYCEVSELKEIDLFYNKMKEAFIFYFDDKESASIIRQDVDLWGIGLNTGKKFTDNGIPLSCKSIYIDDRAISEYNKFEKYFNTKL